MPSQFDCRLKTQPEKPLREQWIPIDEALCKHLGIEVDPERFAYSWVDTIGLLVVVGKTPEQITETLKEDYRPELLTIWEWLQENCIMAGYHVHK